MVTNETVDKRKQLKKEGKNICHGEICKKQGGVIKLLDEFVKGLQTCKECFERREQRRLLKEKGQNICFGLKCNGKIYDLDKFPCNSNRGYVECKVCAAYKINIRYHQNGHFYRKQIVEHKTDKCCAQCGETDIRLLELDHIVGEKLFTIANSKSSKANKEEIDKTQILCVECHRTKTYTEKERTHGDQEMILKYSYTEEETIIKTESKKCGGPMCNGQLRDVSMFGIRKYGDKSNRSYVCIKCTRYKNIVYHLKAKNHVIQKKLDIGKCTHCSKQVTKDNFFVFDFDHLRDKSDCVARLTGRASIQRIDAEIEKCHLLCCKCHKLKTVTQLNYRYEFPK